MQFISDDRGDSLFLLREPVRTGEPDWVALKSLFIQFREKKEVSRQTVTLPSGEAAQCADYDVKLDSRRMRVRACVLRRGAWRYELAAWNPRKTPPMDAFLDGLSFPGPVSPGGRAR